MLDERIYKSGIGIDPNIKLVVDKFINIIINSGCDYDLVGDYPNSQHIVVLNDKADSIAKTESTILYSKIKPICEENKVCVKVDYNRKRGVLFTFTLEVIQDSYWKVLDGNLDFSIFANDADAKKVRNGEMPIQKGGTKYSDEYLSPNFRVVSEMEMELLEPDVNMGVDGGVRTHGDGESKELKTYDKRDNIANLPSEYNPSKQFNSKLDSSLDNLENSFVNGLQGKPINPDDVDDVEPQNVSYDYKTEVIPDDTASQENGLTADMLDKAYKAPPGMVPLGGSASPVQKDLAGVGAPVSNVSLSGFRSMDNNRA